MNDDPTGTPDVEDVEYRRVCGASLLARIYRPAGSGPFPAVVSIHGGAWISGDRLHNEPIDQALVSAGAVVVAVDFRMPPSFRYPASVADINYCIRWVKSQANELRTRLKRAPQISLPPLLVLQGTKDSNVTPDMAARFVDEYCHVGGRGALRTFKDQPHTFVTKDPSTAESVEALRLICEFVTRRGSGI